MSVHRHRPVLFIVAAAAVVWLLAMGGYLLARSTRVTGEKVRAYLRSIDLSRLRGEERARALRELARKLNALSLEERRNARLDREWSRWFAAMTEQEVGEFIDATLPTGVKQMLTAFEELPEARRKKAIDDALKRLREAGEQLESGQGQTDSWGTNSPPVLSEEMRQKVTTTGLKAFYSDSTALTKAELAPLLEELQRMAERGAFLRRR